MAAHQDTHATPPVNEIRALFLDGPDRLTREEAAGVFYFLLGVMDAAPSRDDALTVKALLDTALTEGLRVRAMRRGR